MTENLFPRSQRATVMSGGSTLLVVDDVRFKSEDGYYIIVGTDGIAYKGHFPVAPFKGLGFNVTGYKLKPSKYGEQYQVQFAYPVFPDPANAMDAKRFLSEFFADEPIGLTKLINKANKKEKNIFDVILNTPHDLLKLSKDILSTTHAEQLSKVLNSYKKLMDTTTRFFELKMPSSAVHKLIETFGKEITVNMLEENFWSMISKLPEIDFKTADISATELGLSKDDEKRIEAGINYRMQAVNMNGDTYAIEGQFVKECSYLLKLNDFLVKDVLSKMENMVMKNNRVFFKKIYEDERYIARRIIRANQNPITTISKPAPVEDIELSTTQIEALKTLLQSRVSILTGGPGTGKTTLVNSIINTYLNNHRDNIRESLTKIALACPTGKAAKRMSEACGGIEASTIHRMLEAKIDEETKQAYFLRNQDNPIDAELLIIDESSMLDTELMASLLKGTRPECQIIFVGDVDQLPSISAGNILKDMIDSEAVPTCVLEENFRQKKGSEIIDNAIKINRGLDIDFIPKYKKSEFLFIETVSEQESEEKILQLINEIPKKYGIDQKDIQVMIPVGKSGQGMETRFCATDMNPKLQEEMNGKENGRMETTYGNKVFRVGDRVVQNENNYDKLIFNGDTGVITSIAFGGKLMYVNFGDRRNIEFTREEFISLTHAYAMTVHKCQGNEFEAVIIGLDKTHGPMLRRKVLYTAVTRGARLVVIVGDKNSVLRAIENTSGDNDRKTALCENLIDAQNKINAHNKVILHSQTQAKLAL